MASSTSYRQPTLRQIEVFKAVIEAGTVSRAAQVLNMSQPAASKLLSNLEADIGLELFERRRGLLVPTQRGIRFYEEVDRIFAGLNQIHRAVENLRQEERGQLTIGVMPGLSGPFICSAIRAFVADHPDVHVSLHARSSQFLIEWMRSGQLDVCLVTSRVEDVHIVAEPFLRMPMVCILPLHHPLTARQVLRPEDIAEEPFISFTSGIYTRLKLDQVFESVGLRPNVIIEATTSQNVSELVASGLGIALGHPTFAQTVRGRVAVLPFEPTYLMDFLMCRPRHGRNRRLVTAFLDRLRETAEVFSREIVTRLPGP